MSEEVRTRNWTGWKKAVRKSFDWDVDTDEDLMHKSPELVVTAATSSAAQTSAPTEVAAPTNVSAPTEVAKEECKTYTFSSYHALLTVTALLAGAAGFLLGSRRANK